MVRFNCPNCQERLEVDSGFRGSVARCDKCGALIHVPHKKGRKAGAPVKRPKRPSPLTPGPPPDVPTAMAAQRRARMTWLAAIIVTAILIGAGLGAAWVAGIRP